MLASGRFALLWRVVLALAVSAGALLVMVAPAAAHAALVSASPAAGEQLEVAPSEVRLEFNETIEAGPNALRVFDAGGARVDAGAIDTGERNQIAVRLPADLAESAYVVAYRVTSADAHPIAGTTTFTVGDAPALDRATIESIAGVSAGWIGVLGSLLRGVGYVGSLLAAGAIVFVRVVSPVTDRRAAPLGMRAALVGLGATLAHIPVQASAISGYGLLEALTDGPTLEATLTSSFGQGALVRSAGLVVLAFAWRLDRRRWVVLAASLVIIGSYPLDGHPRSIDPTWLLVTGDAIHVAAVAAWTAGLVLSYLVFRDLRQADDHEAAAALVARFSRFALWSVVILTIAGTAMSLPLVRSFDALTSTRYGWMLVAKLAVVAVVFGVAAYNRRRLVPALAAPPVHADAAPDAAVDTPVGPSRGPADAWRTLHRTVRVELALLAVIAAITGFLVTTQPAAVAAGLSGPTFASVPFGDELTLDVTIDPSAPGTNTLHVYVLEPSGQPSDQVERVRWEFTYLPEQIGPIVVEPFVAGPGHWTAVIDDLRFEGPWEMRVIGGVGRFDEASATIAFSINP